jgi:hypothetical protein
MDALSKRGPRRRARCLQGAARKARTDAGFRPHRNHSSGDSAGTALPGSRAAAAASAAPSFGEAQGPQRQPSGGRSSPPSPPGSPPDAAAWPGPLAPSRPSSR